MKIKPRTLRREDIAREIAILLGLPINPRAGDKAYRIVNIIFTTIVSALLRGETIRIQGFGTFLPITKPQRSHGFYYNQFPGHRWEIRSYPPRKTVRFIASPSLRKFASQGVEDDGSVSTLHQG